jgi:S-DNA-T family DNA segregation ATPase FtsK/SpoIIIE
LAKKTASKSAPKNSAKKSKDSGIFTGLGYLLCAAIIFCSFITVNDRNLLGIFGEVISRVLYLIIGKAAYIIPFIVGFFGLNMLKKEQEHHEAGITLGFALLAAGLSLFLALIFSGPEAESFKLAKVDVFYSSKELAGFWLKTPAYYRIFDRDFIFYTGGVFGKFGAKFLSQWFNIVGAYIGTLIILVVSLVLLGREKLLIAVYQIGKEAIKAGAGFFAYLGSVLTGSIRETAEKVKEEADKSGKKDDRKKETNKEKQKNSSEEKKKDKKEEDEDEDVEEEKPKKKEKLTITRQVEAEKKQGATQALIIKGDYTLPPTSLLKSEKAADGEKEYDYAPDAEKLKKTLSDFGIEAEIVNVVDGPVISRFDLELATGVKVSRVENLSADIALAMKVEMVRVAAVPGKSLLGIEVPKIEKKTIYLKELIEDELFTGSPSLLTLAIGRDLSGKPIIARLEDMPHMLIAGSTGSGKSVCINSIIMSILYKATPDEVKLLLVDPKKVELTQYNDMPHLIAPVITDPKHAAYVLRRLVAEMQSRYDLLSEEGAQNIEIYNRKVMEFNEDIRKDPDVQPEDFKKSLPFIVLIIDELADLMTMAKSSVEESLQRLAQLARAVGIHIILATQRPSVDVITGIIKANFPSRIAFKVKSQIDSRTIMDTKGAEALLGKGDMLYNPANMVKPVRGQAAFVRDEIPKIVSFIKKQRKAVYSDEFNIKEDDLPTGAGFSDEDDMDPDLYKRACDFARDKGKISTSYLQRKLGIGYSRAARIVDMMEEKGLITSADGNKPREWKGE